MHHEALTMTGAQFLAWMARVGLNIRQAGGVLGKSRDTIARYRTDGVPEREAKVVGLACAAYAHGLPPWGAKRQTK